MSYGYVWVTIGVAQVAFVVMVGILQYINWSRRRIDALVDTPDGSGPGAIARLASSRFWWRRMAAARQLAVVAGADDRGIIRRLLLDHHPGVQSAATACLLRYADEDLIALVIDGLASRSAAVRMYQGRVLRQRDELTRPLLLDRLRADAPPPKLYSYIYLAELLDSPECIERVAALSIHQHPEIRVAVARALQHTPDEMCVIKLLAMLRDPDWRVRAQAARGLANAPEERVIKELSRALTDQTWWVRFRAGLALAAMGDAGGKALDLAQDLPDRYARDMAAFVRGLSASSIAELSAG